MCYDPPVAMRPLSIRLDDQVRGLLAEGSRRTPLKKQELIRRTLRLHLRQVIDQAAMMDPALSRLTSVKPWPRNALRRAYKRIGKDWDRVELAAAAAQGSPRFED
jgi:hypothetical protein